MWFCNTERNSKIFFYKKKCEIEEDRKKIRFLIWGNHAALIKISEVILERQNAARRKLSFSDRCTYWF